MAPPFLALLFVTRGEIEVDYLVWPAGLVLFFIGVGLRVWSQVHLHYRLRVRKTLTTGGPYTIVRNPIYIANTLMLLASTVMGELIWFIPIMLAWCMLVYGTVVRREESHLAIKYGQPYLDYLQRVPRFLPRTLSISQCKGDLRHRSFLLPSLAAEVHCLLLLLPLIGKEIVTHW